MKAISYVKGKVQLAFASAIVTLLAVSAISYYGMEVSIDGERMVRHTHEVLEDIQDLRFAWQSISSGSRGYALTGKDFYLRSYATGIVMVSRDLVTLRDLTVDNPVQQGVVPSLEALIEKKIQNSRVLIDLRKTRGLAAASASIQDSSDEQITGAFSAGITRLQTEELRLLTLRESATRRQLSRTKASLLFGALLGVLVACTAGWTAKRDSATQEMAGIALRDGEARFRNLANNMSQLAWITDETGTFLWYNQRWFDYFGTTPEEMANPDWETSVHHPDHHQRVMNEVTRCFASGEIWEDTFPLMGADGVYHWFLSRAVPIRNANGRVLSWFGTNTDVSELQHSRGNLAQTEARYRGLLEAAPDAMVVVDQRGEIVLLNVQAERQFGYRRDELIGQRVKNIIPEGFAERLIADGTRTAAEALEQQIDTGIELNGLRKDGSLFPIEIMLSPLQSAEGTLITAAIRNITVRKEAEEHLAHTEARYRGLLEAAPDAMVVVDQRGRIVLLNVQAEKQFGYRRDELLEQEVKNIIPEGFAERLISDGTRTATEALDQQIDTGIELNGLRKDGSLFPIEIMLSPLQSAGGTLVTAAIRNITVRRRAEEQLAHTETRYRGLLEAAPDAMVVVDQHGNIVLLNVQAEKQFGYRRDELLGQRVKNIIPEGFAERLVTDALRSAEDALAQQIGTGIELLGRRKNLSEFPIEIMLSPLKSTEGILVTAAIRDITLRKKAEENLVQKVDELHHSNLELVQLADKARAMAQQMTHSAEHDFLTGLPNRLLLKDRVGKAISLASRNKNPVAVLFLDLDGFKHINDSLGHAIGDKLLQSIAARLTNCVRSPDTVSRQGGDEFVVLLSEMRRAEDAVLVCRRLLQAVAEAHSIGHHDLHVTASIGVSVFPDDGEDAETLIKNADTAMYQAKENGRQNHQYFKPAMNARAVERQSIEEHLRRALERREFTLHYQPKVNLRTGCITGAEALLRWNHPSRGSVSPAQFIPVAEDCGLILQIGAWVLKEACTQAQEWAKAGLPTLTMAVNVSAMQFRNESFLEDTITILRQTGLDPKYLELELTESALMKHAESTASILSRLRECGVQVAVDDFGTGYSSLSYLRKFPLDALKIDQSFVQQITTTPDDTTIVRAIISMGLSMNLRIIAEGVETEDQLNFLKIHQCEEAQGYHFSRPVPPKQFAELLSATKAASFLGPERSLPVADSLA